MDRTKISGASDPIQSGVGPYGDDNTNTNTNTNSDNDDNLSFRSSRTGDTSETSSSSALLDPDGRTSAYQPLWVRLACILLDFLTQTYDQIRIVPEIVLFERWLCESYFPGQGHSHELCRSPDLQYELARLRSWKAFFDGVASMSLSQ